MIADGKSKHPWDGATGGLRDAIYRFHKAAHRAPTDADRPSVSVFPMTRAAREALRIDRERDRTANQRERRTNSDGTEA